STRDSGSAPGSNSREPLTRPAGATRPGDAQRLRVTVTRWACGLPPFAGRKLTSTTSFTRPAVPSRARAAFGKCSARTVSPAPAILREPDATGLPFSLATPERRPAPGASTCSLRPLASAFESDVVNECAPMSPGECLRGLATTGGAGGAGAGVARGPGLTSAGPQSGSVAPGITRCG